MSKKDLQLRWLTVLLFLLFIGVCKSTKRIQRRFMWKQVDDTMDGIFDSMASSARAMKTMIGEFMPGMVVSPTHSVMHSSILDYLPKETTKIKYIIRSPTTKPMKMVKMNAPKKVVKIMTMPKPIVEVSPNKQKLSFGNAAALRQLEKEQELIAEGRLPIESSEENHKHNDDIINGQIHYFNTEWKPISTQKPYPMSHLHTDALSEALPQPEKQVYHAINDIGGVYEETKRKNTYEVTEHTPEETVAVPFTQQFHNSRGFVPIRTHHTHNIIQHNARSGLSPTAISTTTTSEAPNYPSGYLKKSHDRSVYAPKHIKSYPKINWMRPTNSSIVEIKPKPTQLIKLPAKNQSRGIAGPTIVPTMQESSTQIKLRKIEPPVLPTSDERLRPKSSKLPPTTKPRDIRQRGSIKFGDKLTELYK